MNYSYYVIVGLLLALLSSCSAKQEKESNQPPNIILFLVDDMGWQDTSVPFADHITPLNKRYSTPSMERLANEGMVFTQAYASAICSPTRVSLMSGMNAARHRVTNWTLWRNASTDRRSEVLEFPKWNVNGVQPVDSIPYATHATLLPQLLKNNGYYTIHCGKAHFGAMNTPSANPLNCGFDVNIAGHAAGGLGSYLGEDNFGNKKGEHTKPWGIPGMEKYHGDSINITEALTIEAKAALDKALKTNKPFYLYMAHYAVHMPIMADRRFYQKYIDQGLPKVEARYASMLEAMDKSLGDLMNYLDEKKIADNTIVMFMSDNGGYTLRPRAGKPHTQNAPLNCGKGSAYEGGIREPMIVRWPGKTEKKTRCNDYLLIEDFFPTILEMAQINNYQTVQKVDGKSFVPMLTQAGTTAKNRDLIWHCPNLWGGSGPGIGTTSTIRSNDWKLIYYYDTQTFELFNIKEDIGETINRAQDQKQIVKDLAIKLGTQLRSMDAQRPKFKSTGKPAPWPDQV